MAPALTSPSFHLRHDDDAFGVKKRNNALEDKEEGFDECPTNKSSTTMIVSSQPTKTNDGDDIAMPPYSAMMVSQEEEYDDDHHIQQQVSSSNSPSSSSPPSKQQKDEKPKVADEDDVLVSTANILPLRRSPRKRKSLYSPSSTTTTKSKSIDTDTRNTATETLPPPQPRRRSPRKKKLPRKSVSGSMLARCVLNEQDEDDKEDQCDHEDNLIQKTITTATMPSSSRPPVSHLSSTSDCSSATGSPKKSDKTEEKEEKACMVPTPLRRSPRKRKSVSITTATKTETASFSLSCSHIQSPVGRKSTIEKSDNLMWSAENTATPTRKRKIIINNVCTMGTPHPSKAISLSLGGDKENDTSIACMSPQSNIPSTKLRFEEREMMMTTTSTATTQVEEPTPTNYTVEDLENRMSSLFPRSKTTEMPCVASRLFASFTLHGNNGSPSSLTTATGNRIRQHSSIKSILPLLDALVDLEMVLLCDHHVGDLRHQQQQQQKGLSALAQKQKKGSIDTSQKLPPSERKVHFAAFDGSSMRPPSDVMEGSHQAQQECITQLTKVQQACNEIVHSTEDKAETIDCLKALAKFLKTGFAAYHTLVATSLSSQSSQHNKQISSYFPVRRVGKAAISYAQDLESLAHGEPTSWDFRLANASAQLVRYWLRTVLNPVPDRASTQDASQEWISRVCESIILESDNDHVAVDDGSLSSLVSDAISNIYHYVGGDLDHTTVWPIKMNFPTSFCQSELCHRGIRKSNQQDFTSQDWTTLGYHIQVATGYLAAIRSAEFLHQLLKIVVNNPTHIESWKKTIQSSGEQLGNIIEHTTTTLQTQDDHLVLLGIPPKQLLESLEKLLNQDQSTKRSSSCLNSLLALGKRYVLLEPKKYSPTNSNRRTSTANSNSRYYQLRRQIEPLEKLQDYYERTITTIDFPTVVDVERETRERSK